MEIIINKIFKFFYFFFKIVFFILFLFFFLLLIIYFFRFFHIILDFISSLLNYFMLKLFIFSFKHKFFFEESVLYVLFCYKKFFLFFEKIFNLVYLFFSKIFFVFENFFSFRIFEAKLRSYLKLIDYQRNPLYYVYRNVVPKYLYYNIRTVKLFGLSKVNFLRRLNIQFGNFFNFYDVRHEKIFKYKKIGLYTTNFNVVSKRRIEYSNHVYNDFLQIDRADLKSSYYGRDYIFSEYFQGMDKRRFKVKKEGEEKTLSSRKMFQHNYLFYSFFKRKYSSRLFFVKTWIHYNFAGTSWTLELFYFLFIYLLLGGLLFDFFVSEEEGDQFIFNDNERAFEGHTYNEYRSYYLYNVFPLLTSPEDFELEPFPELLNYNTRAFSMSEELNSNELFWDLTANHYFGGPLTSRYFELPDTSLPLTFKNYILTEREMNRVNFIRTIDDYDIFSNLNFFFREVRSVLILYPFYRLFFSFLPYGFKDFLYFTDSGMVYKLLLSFLLYLPIAFLIILLKLCVICLDLFLYFVFFKFLKS